MGVVKSLVHNPKRGPPYAVANVEGIKGSFTFNITTGVWQEKNHPKVGVVVHLEKLEKRGSGWRAMSARLWRPSDEIKQGQQNRPNQQSAKQTEESKP